jgi:Zn-dependent protease with chaperone function
MAGASSLFTREVAMRRAVRAALLAVLASLLAGSGLRAQEEAEGGRGEKVDGYAEWRAGGCLIADAQRVCPAPKLKFKGEGEAKSFASIPLGYEVKAKGKRQRDGSLLAAELEAKPNGSAMFEGEVRSATDQAEAQARHSGRFGDAKAPVGKLVESGPQVERVRRIVDNLLPEYIPRESVRAYVIENKEWNAFAMGNYSIYVFSGLLDDMDDDEVAIVLGHELVHASHEHSRKQFKKEMWIQIAMLGALGAASTIDSDTQQALAGLAVIAAGSAWKNGYGRGMEDQADRVGLRYAYEAGYDITKGPRLWNRFAKKYGEGNKAANFFFSDHSLSAARATRLEKEIAYNYPDGPKPDGPAQASRPARAGGPTTVAIAPVAVPDGAQALAPTQAPAASAAAPASAPRSGSKRTEIKAGMTSDEVRRALGEPEAEVVFGEKTRWSYPGITVVFVAGKVKDVQF